VKRKISRQLFLSAAMVMVIWSGASPAWAAPAATDTSLTIASGGNTLTSGESLASGSVVTLTATVMAGTTPVIVGQVNFCDASATYCTDIHLLGAAQLTSAGTAVYKFRPGVGSHSYKAVFVGTPNGALACAGSTSSTVTLTTTAIGWPTNTTIANSGGATNPILTATVSGAAGAALSGTVSFLDSSNGNALLGTATLAAVSASLNFMNISNPAAGIFPYQVVSADFNGDGIPDLAVLDACSPNPDCGAKNGVVTTLLGNGNGTFTATATTPAGGYDPYGIVVGVFNGDGIPDLAVLDSNDSTKNFSITVLVGDGTGNFTIKTSGPFTGDHAFALATIDFDGNGILDLAVVNESSNSVTLLRGKGDGTFTALPVSLATGIGPHAIAVADFNGDGIPDLAVVNDGSSAGGTVTVLLGNGDGTFTASPTSPETAGCDDSIAVADFNGDGIPDLAVTNGCSNTVTVLLGNGDGTFLPAAKSPPTGIQPISITVGDFNGDGIPDLATANSGDNANKFKGTVTVLLGNGDGTFTPTTTSPVTVAPAKSVAVADFTGDGVSDLAVANVAESDGTYEGTVAVLLAENQMATATVTPVNVLTAGSGTHQAVASYLGNTDFDASTSLPTVLTAEPGTPTVTLTPSANTATYGTSVTLTATVTGKGLTPTGTVTFYDGVAALRLVALNGSGVAACSTTTLAVGAHSISASYSGDANYNPVTSSAVVLTVSAPLTPTVTVTPSSTGITTLQSLTVAVAVSGGSANPTPTGSVNLTGGGYTSAVMTLLSGGATIGIPAGSLAAGSDTLTVTYTPDSSSASTFLTATQSATVTVSTPIGAAIPAVTVTPSATTITDEQSLVVTVAVAGGSGQPKPTGTVTLSSGAYSAHQPLSGGIASLTIPAGTLSSGANTLTATYAGDETYGSASGTTTVTGSPFVIAIPVPSSVAPGSSATVTATLTTGSTFSGTMDLTCTLTAFPTDAPSLPTCSLNPASVTIATGGSGTTTFTVKTTAASSSAVLRPSRLNLQGLGGAGAALAGLLMLGIPSRRRRWTSMLFLLWIVVATGAIGCSSVNTLPGLNNPTPDAPGTTAGGYTFTVTGSDSTNALISASTNVTVTVQ
jgi:hypothetical protein